MKKLQFDEFLDSINFTTHDFEEFWEIGNATSLSEENNGQQLEFHRGPLLYALIRFLKPKKILEFGTGGGYSALCMAKALYENKIEGKITTIDRVGYDEKIWRFYKLPNETQPQKKKISNKEVWELIANKNWIEKITPVRGYSGVAIENVHDTDFDFCYIDGVHTYDGTKHDFFSFLKIASNKFSVLFDDYIERDYYGVKEFIDNEVEPFFDLTLIDSDPNDELKQFIKKKHDYGMVFFSYNQNSPAMNIYKKNSIESFLKSYRLSDKRIRSKRYDVEKTLPFMKKVRFKFWK